MNNVLIITGAAECLHDDFRALPIINDVHWMAIGLDAVDKNLLYLDYMATYHPDEIPAIKARREAVGGNTDYKVISHEDRNKPDIIIKDWWQPSGSSALLGIQAALQLGYAKIILCGCPLIGKSGTGTDYSIFHKGFTAHLDKISNYVRSMSGWTKELLGFPTEAWLNEN